jgi:hypothetical protein
VYPCFIHVVSFSSVAFPSRFSDEDFEITFENLKGYIKYDKGGEGYA